MSGVVICTTQTQTHTTVGTFPVPFKLRKLKLQIENTPNANASISQKLPYIAKKFLRSLEGGFSGNSKKEYFAKLQWKHFFSAFTGHMTYVKCHIIIFQCTITSKKHFIRGRSQI